MSSESLLAIPAPCPFWWIILKGERRGWRELGRHDVIEHIGPIYRLDGNHSQSDCALSCKLDISLWPLKSHAVEPRQGRTGLPHRCRGAVAGVCWMASYPATGNSADDDDGAGRDLGLPLAGIPTWRKLCCWPHLGDVDHPPISHWRRNLLPVLPCGWHAVAAMAGVHMHGRHSRPCCDLGSSGC